MLFRLVRGGALPCALRHTAFGTLSKDIHVC